MQGTTLLLDLAESAVNRYLSLDPEISQQLGDLEGQCIALDITASKMTVYCFPYAGGVALQSEYDGEADCHIAGSVGGLLRMIHGDNPTEVLSKGEVSIQGESRVAQTFSDTLSRVDVDWEELLSNLTGDFAAHRIGNTLKAGGNWLLDGFRALQQDSTDYLQEESGILPTRVEIERFIQEVDVLRDDVARLEARLRRLEVRNTAE